MLPGKPLCPYGIIAGSTSSVLPLGRNVTLNFFVAGLYFTSSIYGLLPPIVLSSPTVPDIQFLKVCEFFALQDGVHRAVQHHFCQVIGRFVQFVDLLAYQAIVTATGGFF